MGLHDHNVAIGGSTSQICCQLANSLCNRTAGKKVRLLTTEHEHSGAISPFLDHPAYEVHQLALNGFMNATELEHQLNSINPDVLLISHYTYDRYELMPVDMILEQTKKHAPSCLTLVDVAQSVGIFPQFPKGDLTVGSLHKWFNGPQGTGFLLLKPNVVDKISPFSCGEAFDPETAAGHFELTGGQAFYQWHGLLEAAKFIERLGVQNVLQRSKVLATYLENELTKDNLRGFTLENKGPVLLVHGNKQDTYPVYAALNERGFHTKCIKKSGVCNLLRLGIPFYESKARLVAFAKTFKELAKQVG